MTRHILLIGITLALLLTARPAVGQDEQKAGQAQQPQNIGDRWQNMSEQEKEKFRAEMRQNRQNWESLAPEERENLRSQMRDRFIGGPARLGREQQLEAIKVIEEQVAKLKAALEAFRPEGGTRPPDLSEEQRAKIREQMMAAMRERQAAIRAIDEQLEKLRGPVRPGVGPALNIGELKQIH